MCFIYICNYPNWFLVHSLTHEGTGSIVLIITMHYHDFIKYTQDNLEDKLVLKNEVL